MNTRSVRSALVLLIIIGLISASRCDIKAIISPEKIASVFNIEEPITVQQESCDTETIQLVSYKADAFSMEVKVTQPGTIFSKRAIEGIDVLAKAGPKVFRKVTLDSGAEGYIFLFPGGDGAGWTCVGHYEHFDLRMLVFLPNKDRILTTDAIFQLLTSGMEVCLKEISIKYKSVGKLSNPGVMSPSISKELRDPS